MGEFTSRLFVGALPALIVPFIAGAFILLFLRRRKFGALAGTFTLKPLLVAPLWGLSMALLERSAPGLDQYAIAGIGLVPAIGLTLVILIVFRRLYWPLSVLPVAFLLGDIIRLGNSIMYVMTRGPGEMFSAWAYIVPGAYALLALMVVALQPAASAPPTRAAPPAAAA